MLLVDEGAFEREIDEAGDDVAGEGRNLAQQQLRRATPAAASRARREWWSRPCRSCSGTGSAEFCWSSSSRRISCSCGIFFSSSLADHDGGIDRRQRRAHVVDELDRAGTIDERVAFAHEVRAWRPRARRSSGDGAPPCWRRRPWFPLRRCPGAGSRRCVRGSLRAAWSCRSGMGPPARCTVDPWLCVPFCAISASQRPNVLARPRTSIVSNPGGDWQEAGDGPGVPPRERCGVRMPCDAQRPQPKAAAVRRNVGGGRGTQTGRQRGLAARPDIIPARKPAGSRCR